jgi:molybdopterin-containing oxidoreductase family iron-sulfur binding subunit
MKNKHTISRRNFLVKSIAALSVIYVVPDIFSNASAVTKPPNIEVSSKTRWGMSIDVDKCVDGCTSCIDACADENGLYGFDRPETDSQWIRKLTLKDIKTEKITVLPMLCQHCENPPCCDVCPTGASFRRVDGIVMVNQHTCIGCRYCMLACPFKARSFVHENLTEQLTNSPRGKGCVESCNFCVNKIDNGSDSTACEEACMKEGHNAISFGDLNDPKSRVSIAISKKPNRRLRADLKLKQTVTYSGF